MNKISTRQLYFFLACIAPVGKLVVLPSVLAGSAKNDMLWPMLIQYAVQAAVIFAVLLLAKRGLNLFELLANTFGKIAARILIAVFTAFLFYAALLPLLEQKLFVQAVFYDTLPSLIAFSPFFVFSAYLCAKALGSFGRTWDILGPLAIVGLIGILVLSVTNADYGALLPVGASGASGIFNATAQASSWFFDSAIVLTLLGKIDYKKGTAWKGTLFYLSGGLGILIFLATFYGVFEGTALNQIFAFAKTSKYFSGITVLGRVDYAFIYTLALVLLFYSVLPLQCGIDCIIQAYGKKKYLPTILSVIVNIVFLALSILLDYRFGDVLQAISKTAFWIFPVFTVLLPPLCLLLRRDSRERA